MTSEAGEFCLCRVKEWFWGRVRRDTGVVALAAVVVGGLMGTPVHAQEEASELMKLSLEELLSLEITTASKHKQNINLVPAVVTVYTKEQIQDLGARDLVDLLRLTPGFLELGDGNERNFGTRGVSATTSQHVLIMINGHKLTDLLTSTTGPDWVSLDYVDRVEIVRGPGSALYGGNALSGVINIITRTGASYGKSSLAVTYGTGNTVKTDYQFGRKFSDQEELFVSVGFRQSGGLPVDQDRSRDLSATFTNRGVTFARPATGGTEYINKYYPSYDLLGIYRRDRFTLTANLEKSAYGLRRPQSDWNIVDIRKEWFDTPNRTDNRQFLEFAFELLPPGRPVQWGLKTSFDHFGQDLYQLLNSQITHRNVGQTNRLIGDNWRGNVESQVSTESVGVGKNRFTIAGVEFNYTGQDYKLYTPYADTSGFFIGVIDRGVKPVSDDREVNFSSFVQSEGYFFKDKLAITLGVRNDNNNTYGAVFSPRVAFVLSQSDLLKYKLLAATAFLPPPFLYRSGTRAFRYEGNPNIKPQGIRSVEGAIFGNYKSRFMYNLNGFFNQIANFIREDPDTLAATGIRLYDNRGTMKLAGLESSLRVQFGGWSPFVNVAVCKDAGSDPFFLSGDGELRNWPVLSSSGGISCRSGNFSTHLTYNYWSQNHFPIGAAVAARSPNPDYNSGYKIPAQWVLHANVSYQVRGFPFGAAVHNLLDRKELMGGSVPIPQSGEPRTILANLRYEF